MEGEAMVDMEVRDSEDEFMQEEQLIQQRESQQSQSLLQERDSRNFNNSEPSAKKARVRNVSRDSPRPAGNNLGANNNATFNRDVLDTITPLPAETPLKSKENDSTNLEGMAQHMSRNEEFMKNFAQFMAKKGYVYKNPEHQQTSIGERPSLQRSQIYEVMQCSTEDALRQLPGQPDKHQQCDMQLMQIPTANVMREGNKLVQQTGQTDNFIENSASEVTIYKRAVVLNESDDTTTFVNSKRHSNSSDELVNVSDDSLNDYNNIAKLIQDNQIAGRRERDERSNQQQRNRRYVEIADTANF